MALRQTVIRKFLYSFYSNIWYDRKGNRLEKKSNSKTTTTKKKKQLKSTSHQKLPAEYLKGDKNVAFMKIARLLSFRMLMMRNPPLLIHL